MEASRRLPEYVEKGRSLSTCGCGDWPGNGSWTCVVIMSGHGVEV